MHATAEPAPQRRNRVDLPEFPSHDATMLLATHDAAITDAIELMARQWDTPPDLAMLARRANLSPGHFQRAFRARVGVSPKRFAQHLKLTRAEDLLRRRANVLDVAEGAAVSSLGRLHDLTVRCVAMTPAELRANGANLAIRFGTLQTPVGPALVGVTNRGICWLGFGDPQDQLRQLQQTWSAATLVPDEAAATEVGQQLTAADARANGRPITVLLGGTNFQLQVWRALMRIPPGSVATYGDLAADLGRPSASRAVGAACGANRVSWLIPCHRVIGQTGTLTGYRWGTDHKRALLAHESARRPTAAKVAL